MIPTLVHAATTQDFTPFHIRATLAAYECADLSSCAALLSRDEPVGFRLQASYFLAAAPKSNQKAPPPGNCAPHRKSRSAMRGPLRFSPASGSSVRPGMACRWTPLRLRSAGYRAIALLLLRWPGADSGAAFLAYFLSLLTRSRSPAGEKLRPVGEEDPARAQAHAARFQSRGRWNALRLFQPTSYAAYWAPPSNFFLGNDFLSSAKLPVALTLLRQSDALQGRQLTCNTPDRDRRVMRDSCHSLSEELI